MSNLTAADSILHPYLGVVGGRVSNWTVSEDILLLQNAVRVMLSGFDNPRPLPPAKVRRATSMAAKANSTPPPAYGSTFVFPSRNISSSDFGADIPNTPIEPTRRLIAAWDTDSPSPNIGYESLLPGGLEWKNEKSREELHELLLKANGIIKEREQELDMATDMVKRVYDHNSILKSKHEEFLAKIPMSPSLSHCPSPDPSSKSMHHLSHSVSESNLPDPLKSHTRKVSIAVADISLLADQNAELLSKLQKLEEDATSADIAGRRELRRLEKEIVYLRDALEKTQAKSEELEGKVQNAVTSEAVRRKREREAMRNAARGNKTEVSVLDFAPPGSKFGGPSERFSLLDLPKDESPIRNGLGSPLSCDLDCPDEDVVSDQILITRLLNKVNELEEANARILHQQAETANQIAHVQQDTLNMTKVYELLSDHDAIQLELEPEEDGKRPTANDKSEIPTIRFKSLRRNMENSISQDGSFLFPETTHTTKARKTVLGLFGEQEGTSAKDETKAPDVERSLHRHPSVELFGSRSSSSTSSLAGQQSPLPFFSPVTQSDKLHGRTLQNELEGMFGQDSWNLPGPNHLRTASLSNLSLFSTPSTPSPAPGTSSCVLPRVSTPTAAEFECDSGLQTPRHTPGLLSAENVLKLSVEPPSPDAGTNIAQKHASRLQTMSRTLRSRKGRWVERMSYDGNPQQAALTPSLKPRRRTHQQLSNAVSDTTLDNVDDPESDERHSQQMTTPRAHRDVEYEHGNEKDGQSIDRRAEDKSFLFQVWLWFQFAIVVIFFIFAMARKGPGLLGRGGVSKERRVVAGR